MRLVRLDRRSVEMEEIVNRTKLAIWVGLAGLDSPSLTVDG